MEVLGFTHPVLSADALACWNFPAQIRVAVLDHHTPSGDMELSRVSGRRQPLRELDRRIDRRAGDPEWSDPSLIESLGLNDGSGAVLSEFAAEYGAMSTFFR